MKKQTIKYVEPADYFPKRIRKKCGLGEYANLKNKKRNMVISWFYRAIKKA